LRIEERENRSRRVAAPAKVNLYLEVGPPRPDGYHDIDSLFLTVSLFDELELEATRDGEIVLEEDGISAGETNLVYRAAAALRRYATDSTIGARIRLRKRIPQGGGLGGGSSDAAATLVALSRLWEVDIDPGRLAALAAELGSDVPFFLHGGLAICRGRGEKVLPLADDTFADAPPSIVLVLPGIHTPTPVVYRALDAEGEHGDVLTRSSPLDSLTSADSQRRLTDGAVIFNRLESVTFRLFPELERIRQRMMAETFVRVWMTGSGSTLCGLAPSREAAEAASLRLAAELGDEVRVVVVEGLPRNLA